MCNVFLSVSDDVSVCCFRNLARTGENVCKFFVGEVHIFRPATKGNGNQAIAHPRGARRGAEGARAPPLNGNRLNTNLLLTFVKTQNNSAHAYIAV